MSDDDGDLRARLARLDPARRPEAADLIASRTAQEIREHIMQTVETAPDTSPAHPERPRRRLLVAAAAAAAVVAVVVGVTLAAGGDGVTPSGDGGGKQLALSAPAGGPAMSSCIQFDVKFLRDMPVAFGGTVTAVGDGRVRFDVDRWYRGGDAAVVEVTQPQSGMPVSIDGVEFEAGKRYLVTATDGVVNGCGYSGLATAELEQAFGEAFGTS